MILESRTVQSKKLASLKITRPDQIISWSLQGELLLDDHGLTALQIWGEGRKL